MLQARNRGSLAVLVAAASWCTVAGGCDREVTVAGSGGAGGAQVTGGGAPTTSGSTVSSSSGGDACGGVLSGSCSTEGKVCAFGGTACFEKYTCTGGVWQTETICIDTPKPCPVPPTDEDIGSLLHQKCGNPSQVCASNDGCGGCSVTCTNGYWEQSGEQLCYSVGPTC